MRNARVLGKINKIFQYQAPRLWPKFLKKIPIIFFFLSQRASASFAVVDFSQLIPSFLSARDGTFFG